MEQGQRLKAQRIEDLQVEKLTLDQEKGILQSRQELERLRSMGNTGGGGQQDVNPELSLVKEFVKDGMELTKATDMISKMPPAQRLQLLMLAQSKGGAQYMAPFLAVAGQPDTSVDQAIKLMEKAQEMALKNQPSGPQPMTINDVLSIFDRLKPGEDQQNQMAYLAEKQEKLEVKLEQEREARHQTEIKYQNELAALRQQNLENQMKELGIKLEEIKKGDRSNQSPLAYFKEAKETLTAMGVPIGDAATAKSPLEEANAIVKTVMDSPGLGKVFDAAGQRIRDGGFSRRSTQPAVQPSTGLAPGEQILCDNCLAQGRKTALPITRGVIAGTEAVTCPVCNKTYKKGAGGQPGGGQPGDGQPGPDSPSKRFPGSF